MRNIDEHGDLKCKYCGLAFPIVDDLAAHEGIVHGDNLDDYFIENGKFVLKSTSNPIDQFYNLLKSKLTGQVINGVLIGCLTEDELEEAYREFKG